MAWRSGAACKKKSLGQCASRADSTANNALNCRSLRSLDSQKLRFCLPVSLIVRQKHMSRVQLVEIDLRAITSAEELHSLLMESLNFPGWYGANWDAFWDAITGLVEMPYTVRFLGWAQFSQRLLVRRCY